MAWFMEWWQSIGLIGQIMACMAIPTSIVLLLQAVLMLFGAGFGGDGDSGFDTDGAGIDTDGFDTDGAGFDADGFDTDVADFGADGFDADISDTGMTGFDAHGLDAHGFDTHGLDTHGAGSSESGNETVLASAAGKEHPGSDSESVRIITVRGIIAFFAIGGWAGLAATTSGIKAIWSVQIALLAGVAAMIFASFIIRFTLKMQSSGNIDLRNAVGQTAEVYITIPPGRSGVGKVMTLIQERFSEIEAVTDSDEPIKPYSKVEIVGLTNSDCLVVHPSKEDADIKQNDF